MSSYTYTPLEGADSIRVLALNPTTQPDDPLSGTLLPTTLTACHFDLLFGYTALSYVWGPPETPESIFLDGNEFKITASLHEALRDLRDYSRVHYIWADALCINQKDTPERNAQVALMGDIYWAAHHTVIHLGALNNDMSVLLMAAHLSHSLHRQATVAAEALKALRSLSLDQENTSLESSAEDSLPPQLSKEGIDFESYKAIVKQIAEEDLLQRPWFSRVWTYQELILSRQVWVQCGRQRVWWSDLCNMLLPIVDDKRLSDMNESRSIFHNGLQTQRISPMWAAGTPWTGLNPLWEIIRSRQGSQATDPRDMVFGFMALHSDRSRANRRIKIDYEQSLEEVYIAAAQYFLESIHSAQWIWTIWAESITASKLRGQLPSWVPDWGVKVPEYSPFLKGGNVPNRPIDPIARVIVFAPLGYRVVYEVSGILPRWSEYPRAFQEEIWKWKKFEENRNKIQPYSFESVIRRGHLSKKGAQQWRQVVKSLWKEFLRPLGKPSYFLDLLKSKDLWDLYYLMDVYFTDEDGEESSVLEGDNTEKRFRLYEGSDGMLGFVSSNTQAGDCLVDACTFPPEADPWRRPDTTTREALAEGTNFKDDGPNSVPDRFTKHNQRTFFFDRGGTLVVRPYPGDGCEKLDQLVIEDFLKEAPLRGCADVSVDALPSRSINVRHWTLVAFHDGVGDEITGHCWWSLDKEKMRLKNGALSRSKSGGMLQMKSGGLLRLKSRALMEGDEPSESDTSQNDDDGDSEGQGSSDESFSAAPLELFAIH